MNRFAATALALPFLLPACRDSGQNTASPGASPGKSDTPDELLRVTAHPTIRTERPASMETSSFLIKNTSELPIRTTARHTAADREAANLSAQAAGWDSETRASLAMRQLVKLADRMTEGALAPLLADDFSCSSLIPVDLQEITLPGGIRIIRGSNFQSTAEGLFTELSGLRKRVGSQEQSALSFKPVGIETGATGENFTTEVLVEVAALKRASQIDATWRCSWTGEEEPRLTSLTVTRFRELHAPDPLFADATRSAFRQTPSFAQQMMSGIGSWSQRLTRVDDMALTGHHGVAVGDINGDGRDDLYACDGGGLPNRLYLQQADGTVRDHSAEAQVDFLEDSRSALIIDLDNDGDQDLVVATVALVLFLENDGAGVFTLRGGHPGSPGPYSMAAADYDNDGDLDIYVTGYGQHRDGAGARGFEATAPIPYHDANNGGRNLLLANHGQFRFSDVTARTGLDQNNTRWSFAAAWEDYDHDGDSDLYVVNDFGRNNLYRNEGGTFRDIAAEAGVEDMAGGMSAAWGDANGDGKPDLYVGNMFSAAGNRVPYQRRFQDARSAGDSAALQRMARGNSLFHQKADGTFRDVSEDSGVTMGRWAWSSGFVDLNNDGWQDLVVSNGYLSSPRTEDL